MERGSEEKQTGGDAIQNPGGDDRRNPEGGRGENSPEAAEQMRVKHKNRLGPTCHEFGRGRWYRRAEPIRVCWACNLDTCRKHYSRQRWYREGQAGERIYTFHCCQEAAGEDHTTSEESGEGEPLAEFQELIEPKQNWKKQSWEMSRTREKYENKSEEEHREEHRDKKKKGRKKPKHGESVDTCNGKLGG
jgi:hypothetical protein